MPNYQGVWSLSTQYQNRSGWPAPPTLPIGLFAGGLNASNTKLDNIDQFNISTTGNASNFGDLTATKRRITGCSSETRGIFTAGLAGANNAFLNVIEFVTIASEGNGSDFGDLLHTERSPAACASATRGIVGGGYASAENPSGEGNKTDVIQYITIASAGNATDFGNLVQKRDDLTAFSSTTRGIFSGGGFEGYRNEIDFITIASTGNASDFGDLTVGRNDLSGCASPTRGLSFGGYLSSGSSDVIDYITIASAGNATDFGNLIDSNFRQASACSSHTRGVNCGGSLPTALGSATDVIQYVTIASTGNASDFGDLTDSKAFGAACSATHGGIA